MGVIYRPPNTDMRLSTEYIEGILERVKSERNICYMMGDYNIDLLKSSVHSPTSDFLEMMYDKSFYNLISRPTRITNATATLIDNIYTNSVSFDKDKFSGVLTSDISDHFMVFCMFQISDTNNNDDDDFYLIRRYSEKNKNTFVHNLNAIDWNEVLPNSNAQLAFSTFHSLIKKEYDTNFPLIKVERQYNKKITKKHG